MSLLIPARFPTGPFPAEGFKIRWSMLVEVDWVSSSAAQPNGYVEKRNWVESHEKIDCVSCVVLISDFTGYGVVKDVNASSVVE